jgi:hypothetical protein
VVVECDSLIYGYVVGNRNRILRPLIESTGLHGQDVELVVGFSTSFHSIEVSKVPDSRYICRGKGVDTMSHHIA